MSIIRLAGFHGCNQALHPMLLPDMVGVTSLNQKPGRGDLRPWKSPSTVATIASGRNTIYRMGRDTPADGATWLSWTGVVHLVRSLIADDTSERTYFTGDGAPKWTDTVKMLTSPRLLGIPAPLTKLTATGNADGVSATTEVRYYVYTYVTDADEESAPSPVSDQITVKIDDTVAITALAAAPAGNYGINRIRIYRTTSTGSATDFYFLREQASSGTTSTDDCRAVREIIPTTEWLIPPADLHHLTGMWNGMMAGITGRAVRVCVAYAPYAWPLEYEIVSPEGAPVSLATFGQNLVVLTTARPILVAGGTPDGLDEQPIEFRQACVSAKSVVGMGHGVANASPDGLAYVGGGGSRIITQGILTRDDWQALVPSSIIGTTYEGGYIGFYNPGTGLKGFLIDPISPEGIYFFDTGYVGAHVDDVQDTTYVIDGTNIKKWDAGSAMTATFRSKVFRQPHPVNAFSCAEVVADSYAAVAFKLYADSTLVHTESVTSRKAFRLPAGYAARDYQIEVVTTSPVQAVAMAHSMSELATT